MDIQSILADLKKEREKLDRAIGALQGLGTQTRRRGRPAGSHQAADAETQAPPHERCVSQTYFRNDEATLGGAKAKGTVVCGNLCRPKFRSTIDMPLVS